MVTATFDHREQGSTTDQWRGLEVSDLPELDLDRSDRLVVVAAHPDDETLGAGGLIAKFAAAGGAVTVVIATDGEGSHPHSPTHDAATLAARRRLEVADAVRVLAPTAELKLLSLPDGRLGDHGADLLRALDPLVGPTTVVVAPWSADRHPDHAAAAEVASAVAYRNGTRSWHYPIWAWHWGRPTDPEFRHSSLSRVTLSQAAYVAKATAIVRHTSQTAPLSPASGDEPVLSAAFLQHFRHPHELFVAGAGTPSLGQKFFDDFYATGDDPWGFADRWYEKRKRALLLAALPRQRFRSAFEPGCSNGELTVELAQRCDRLLAADISALPLAATARRTVGLAQVLVQQRQLPRDWPSESFDLVVLSEVGYYLDELDLRTLAGQVRGGLTADGVVVLCHWRHPVAGYPLTGDRTHEILRTELGLRLLSTHVEADFRLEVLGGAAVLDVAEAEGLQ